MADDPTDTEVAAAGDFARDTEVTPDPTVSGRYHADLPEAWRVFYAFGGCTMAVALRAAQAAIGRPDLEPISANAVFAAPVPCGPMVIDTAVLRRGRSAAQATAMLRGTDPAGGEPAEREGADVHLTAVYGSRHETHVEFDDTTWPEDAIPL